MSQRNDCLVVVIGKTDYKNLPKLENAISDADAVKATLRSLGFEIFGNNNLEKSDTLKLLNNILDHWEYEAKEIVCYYSGHKILLDGKAYLVPIDSGEILPKSLVKQNFLDLDTIINTLLKNRINSNHSIIIIPDYCRDELLHGDGHDDDKEDPLRGVCREISSEKINIAILYSVTRESITLDKDSESNNSSSAQILLEHIQKNPTIDQTHNIIVKSFGNSSEFYCIQVPCIYQCLSESYRFYFSKTASIHQKPSLDDPVRYHFYDVPIKNQNFIDRSSILDNMKAILSARSSFDECRILALCGLGGMGKTQLMLQYCYLHYKEYEHTFWLKMDGLSTALESFRKLAINLGLDKESAKKMYTEEKIFDWVRAWLQKKTGWLLLLDNVDDEMAAKIFTFLPRIGGDIIITTREHIPPTKAEITFIKKMEEGEALSLLLGVESMRTIDQQSVRFHDAKEIITEMDFMPLAIDLARAYIDTMLISFKEYLSMFRNYRSRAKIFLHYDEDNSHQYNFTIATVWKLSFERIRSENAMAGLILDACSFLQPDAIPINFFERHYSVLESKLAMSSIKSAEGSNNVRRNVRKAIGVLVRFSFVAQARKENTIKEEDSENDILTIHRLVQKVNFSEMNQERRIQLAFNIAEALNKETESLDPYSSTSRTIMNIYIPHIRHFVTVFGDLNQGPLLSIDFENLLVRTVNYLLKNAIYVGVEVLASLAVSVSELIHGRDNISTTDAISVMAEFYLDMGMYINAEPLYQRALTIREKELGSEHVDTATSLNNMGSLYHRQGKYTDTEPLYHQALEIRKNILGPEHPDTVISLRNLAMLYKHQGKYTDSESLYKQTLEIRKKTLGPEHLDTAKSLENLATLYRMQGKHANAEPLYQQVLAIKEKILGPEHPDTALSLNNLAYHHYGYGNYTDAEPLFERVLEINEKVFGSEHPDTSKSLESLAILYTAQKNYANAELLYQRALAINEKVFGSEHPSTAITLDNLANLYSAQENYASAKPLYLRALAIYEKVLGPEHPNIAASLNNLAEFYNDQGMYADAEPLYQRAIEIHEKAMGLEHPDTALFLANLGALYKNQGKYTDAEQLLQRALPILEKGFGLEHLYTINASNNLAFVNEIRTKPCIVNILRTVSRILI